MTEIQTLEILETLRALPSEKAEELKDFAIFLRERYGKPLEIDEDDEWSEQDYADATLTSMAYGYAETEKDK